MRCGLVRPLFSVLFTHLGAVLGAFSRVPFVEIHIDSGLRKTFQASHPFFNVFLVVLLFEDMTEERGRSAPADTGRKGGSLSELYRFAGAWPVNATTRSSLRARRRSHQAVPLRPV